MWILQHENKSDKQYIVGNKEKYVVGRAGVDIVITADSSISRQHAALVIRNGQLFVEDNNSKYGTFHNGSVIRMSPGECRPLNHGHTVRFGVLQSRWRIIQMNFCSMASTLTEQQQNTLKTQLKKLGGRFEDEPHAQCTHLTMPACSLTPKLLFALIRNIPVVSCDYWSQVLISVEAGHDLPPLGDYHPGGDEVNFTPVPARQQLFKGRTFIFMDRKMFLTYMPIIEAAGGTVADMQRIPNYKQQVLRPAVIVMEYLTTSDSQNSQLFNEVSAFLNAHNRRSIPDYEIAMSIMECSTKTWCNPDYLESNTMPSLTSQQLRKYGDENSEEILVPETNHLLSSQANLQQHDSMMSMHVTESQPISQDAARRKRQLYVDESDNDDNDADDAELGALNFMEFPMEIASDHNRKSQDSSAVLRPRTPPPMSEKHNPIYVKGIPAVPVAAHVLASKEVRLLDDAPSSEKSSEMMDITEAETVMEVETAGAVRDKPASKRVRKIFLGGDDSDEENLFEFNVPTKRQKQQEQKSAGHTEEATAPKESIENGVDMPANDCVMRISENGGPNATAASTSSSTTSPFISTLFLKPRKPFVMEIPSPLEIPKRIDTSNWLSFGKVKKEINCEKMDTTSGDYGRIRIVSLDLTQSTMTNNSEDMPSSTSNGHVINFKVFKKCRNTQLASEDRVVVSTKLRPIIETKY